MRKEVGLLIIASFVASGSANADMSRSLLRSPEALAMGGAFTAIAEGRDAPFYNPAGVAANDQLSVHYLTVDATSSDFVLTGWKDLKDLKNPTGSDVNKLMGQNIYAQGTVSGAVLAPGFTIVPFYDVQAALYAQNQALPKIEYGYQTTSGVQTAFAWSVTDGRLRGHGRKNAALLNEWRFGIGAKYLVRQGGYRLLTASELFNLNSTSAKDYIGGKGSGYGLDFGVQRLQRINPDITLSWGLAFLNVGDIAFANGAEPQRGDLSTGLGLTIKHGVGDVTLAYDIQQINEADDFVKKQNLGLRVGIPLMTMYLGLHQGFITYGASFDMWLFRASAYVYKEELGAYARQDTESRMAVRLDLKFGN